MKLYIQITCLFLAIALISCRKDYTCECLTTTTIPGTPTYPTVSKTGKMTRDKAEEKCDKNDARYEQDFMGFPVIMTTECELQD